ncbi:MAG: Fe-S protein assembly co-chaperone HscB [Rubrivivax sp.]|nr:Fe-S protein assembly co-chaperone HscB [Rubrivivax sp.]
MKLDDDDFTLFGVTPRFALDRASLDERWRALQAEVHPDRFAAEGAAAQRVAMQWAVRVNEAYRRLKDPLARAAYLVSLRGVSVDAERNTAMPPAFLMQQMEWREGLDEARTAQQVQAIDQQVAAHEQRLFAQLQQTLDEQQDAQAAAQQVRALMFVARFREDIDRRLEAFDA